MASIPSPANSTPPAHILPTETYQKDSSAAITPVRLRIASGGAGQSGLIRSLAEGFLESEWSQSQSEGFGVAWYASDTTQSFNFLAMNVADLSITYHGIAEEMAVEQGVADRLEYLWRDHWLLVGPKANPAGLSTDTSTPVLRQFKVLFQACISSSATPNPVRFLSRFDKSANNIKETLLWASIGQVPSAFPYSTWYHQCVEFPFRALEVASLLGEYTLVDRGTWWSVEQSVRERLAVFCEGGEEEDDALLNPAHALLATRAVNREVAERFLDWAVGEEGQSVIAEFKRNGHILYTAAPPQSK